MNKEFVPHEESLDMRDLGFSLDEEYDFVNDYWNVEGKPTLIPINLLDTMNTEGWICQAPLYSQAFRWFREKYNLFMLMQVGQHNGEHQTFYFNVFEYGVNLYKSKFRSKTGVYTYEEAELACLRKLIEIVKERK